jgi:hypothetical protein
MTYYQNLHLNHDILSELTLLFILIVLFIFDKKLKPYEM